MKKTITIISVVAIVAILAVTLMACIPSDYNKAEANLKDAGYKVLAYNETDPLFNTIVADFAVKDATALIEGNKGEDHISIVYFKDSNAAKKAYESLKKEYDEEIQYAKEHNIDTSNYVCKRSGKIVYSGTKQAVKDAQ